MFCECALLEKIKKILEFTEFKKQFFLNFLKKNIYFWEIKLNALKIKVFLSSKDSNFIYILFYLEFHFKKCII